MFSLKRLVKYAGGATLLACFVYLASVCTVETDAGCDIPTPGSEEAARLENGRALAAFDILYPCELPASQKLTSIDVVGTPERQTSTMFLEGPFEISIRQSQVAPIVNADPAGASHISQDIFPGVRAEIIERNDGSSKAEYRIVWAREGFYYEVLASGPPQSRRQILLVVTSLQ